MLTCSIMLACSEVSLVAPLSKTLESSIRASMAPNAKAPPVCTDGGTPGRKTQRPARRLQCARTARRGRLNSATRTLPGATGSARTGSARMHPSRPRRRAGPRTGSEPGTAARTSGGGGRAGAARVRPLACPKHGSCRGVGQLVRVGEHQRRERDKREGEVVRRHPEVHWWPAQAGGRLHFDAVQRAQQGSLRWDAAKASVRAAGVARGALGAR